MQRSDIAAVAAAAGALVMIDRLEFSAETSTRIYATYLVVISRLFSYTASLSSSSSS